MGIDVSDQCFSWTFYSSFSLVGWVVVCNKLHQPWNFGLVTASSFAVGLVLGCGLFAVLTAINQRKNGPLICDLSLEETAIRLRDALVGAIQSLGDNSEWVEDAISVKSKPDSTNI
jgi:hypothetical protein